LKYFPQNSTNNTGRNNASNLEQNDGGGINLQKLQLLQQQFLLQQQLQQQQHLQQKQQLQFQQQQHQQHQQIQSQMTQQQQQQPSNLSLNDVEIKLLQHLSFQQQLQQQLAFHAAQLKQVQGNSNQGKHLQQLIQQLELKYQMNNSQISSLIVIRNNLLQVQQQRVCPHFSFCFFLCQ
jgi:chromosome segregation protein